MRSTRSLYMPSRQRESSGMALFILDLCAKTWTEVNTTPRSLYPWKDIRYPLYKGLRRGRYGRIWKISPPPSFETLNVQSVASRYTDCPIAKDPWSAMWHLTSMCQDLRINKYLALQRYAWTFWNGNQTPHHQDIRFIYCHPPDNRTYSLWPLTETEF
jgi:hypothetical protein